MPTIAIDFGTTRTKVAYFDPDARKPELIELGGEVRDVIPSLFYIPREGPPQVGDDAQQMVNDDPEGVVVGLKKEIHKLGKYRCGSGRPSIDRKELAGHLFRYIRERCEREKFYEAVTTCILTVPVTFQDPQRECIRDAARRGGFEKIELIDEPVAAARAWLARDGRNVAAHVVVCDVGGGTTDFALVSHSHGRFEIDPKVQPDGFPQGGNDVDEAILTHLLDDGAENPDAIEALRAGFLVRVRQARETLGRIKQKAEVPISLNGVSLKVPRGVVEECAQKLIPLVADELKKFLARCQTVPGVANPPVLLVGGGSRMPGLQEAVEPLAPGRVYQWNQSDYAIVLGAVEINRADAARLPENSKAPSATKSTFRIRLGEREEGPLSASELLELAHQGRLPDVLVVSVDGGAWRKARIQNGKLQWLSREEVAQADEPLPQKNTEPGIEAKQLATRAKEILNAAIERAGQGTEEARAESRQLVAEALHHAQAACDLEPNWAEAYFTKGTVQHAREEYLLAVAAFTTGLRFDPNNVEAIGCRGQSKLEGGDPAGAEGDLSKALSLTNDSDSRSNLLLVRALARSRSGSRTGAQADIEEVLRVSTDPLTTPQLHLIAGLLYVEEHDRPNDAIRHFAALLNVLPAAPKAESLFAIDNAIEVFGLKDKCVCSQPDGYQVSFVNPIATAQRHLLRTFYEVVHPGDLLAAVDALNRHLGKHDVEDASVYATFNAATFSFFMAGAKAAAEQDKYAVRWLAEWIKAYPNANICEALRSPAIYHRLQQAQRDPFDSTEANTLRDFLTVKWGYTEDHGIFLNQVTVTNLSPFYITDIKVVVRVTRTGQNTSFDIERAKGKLDSGESKQWNNVFTDGGFLGSNIHEVKVILSCTQSSELAPQLKGTAGSLQGYLPQYKHGLPPQMADVAESIRAALGNCPKCGFSYRWNGSSCLHCGYSA